MDIRQFEAMSMLDLPPDERELIAGACEKLTEGFNVFEAIETDGVEPLVTPLEAQGYMREDRSEKNFTAEELLANAPKRHGGFFQVPETI